MEKECETCHFADVNPYQLPCSSCFGWSNWTPEGLKPAPSTIDHPPHYTAGSVECIDAIEAALTPEEFRGYCKGNALKYVWRERHKGGAESLAKAAWYLKRLEGGK